MAPTWAGPGLFSEIANFKLAISVVNESTQFQNFTVTCHFFVSGIFVLLDVDLPFKMTEHCFGNLEFFSRGAAL